MTATQARHMIKAMAEIWNLEARGQALIYRGWLDVEEPWEACAAIGRRPAVFVHFKNEKDSAGNYAEVGTIANCPKMARLTVFGKDSSGNQLDWEIGSQTEFGLSLENMLLHEFGHVLELGEIPEPSGCDEHGVMDRDSSGDCTRGGRHLMKWDKDCVTEYQNEANATYRRITWSSGGTNKGVTTESLTTNRAALAGSYVYDEESSWEEKYLLMNDTQLQAASAASDGYLSFSENHTTPSALSNLDEMPEIFFPAELAGGTSGTRISYLYDGGYFTYDPPYAYSLYSGDVFDDEQSGAYYRACDDTFCGNYPHVRTYTPITTAWDPITQNTMFVVVESTSAWGEDGDGTISVHPGFDAGSYWRIRAGHRLTPADLALPSGGGSDWDYTGKTDMPAAAACADSSFGNSYNCILAWTDNGVRDGAILYTYFKYDETNDEVIFYPNGSQIAVWKRGTSNTVSAPSAGFFANAFHLAWKTATYPADVAYVNNDFGYSTWNTTQYENEEWLFEPPTFHYRHGHESALVWTITD